MQQITMRMVFLKHNSLKSDIFLIPYLFHVFRVHVFQGPGFSGWSLLRVQFFHGPGYSRSRVRVQVLEVVFSMGALL